MQIYLCSIKTKNLGRSLQSRCNFKSWPCLFIPKMKWVINELYLHEAFNNTIDLEFLHAFNSHVGKDNLPSNI